MTTSKAITLKLSRNIPKYMYLIEILPFRSEHDIFMP